MAKNEIDKAESRVADLRKRLEEATARLKTARAELIDTVAFSDQKDVEKKRATVRRLEDEASELTEATPLAEKRVTEARQREEEAARKAALDRANALMPRRLAALQKMDAAWAALGAGFAELRAVEQQIAGEMRVAAQGTPRNVVGGFRFSHFGAAYHHAPEYAKFIKLNMPTRDKRGTLADLIGRRATLYEVSVEEGDEGDTGMRLVPRVERDAQRQEREAGAPEAGDEAEEVREIRDVRQA